MREVETATGYIKSVDLGELSLLSPIYSHKTAYKKKD